jgi:iron complex outermembrane recepter protein
MKTFSFLALSFFFLAGMFTLQAIADNHRQSALDEVTVTAQKRAESLQEAPIAISVISTIQLERQSITSLDDLLGGAVPSLRVIPLGSTPTNLVIGIRGNAPSDVSEVTRDGSVGIYIDGVYLARSHSINLNIADLKRIEVLRGPQGTLFGRNSIGGAVSLITKQPTGQWGLEQVVSMGRFDELRSITRVNLPEMADIKAKFDYLHYERDGWIENTAPNQADYNQSRKDGGRLNLNWQASEFISLDYSYDQSKVEMVQEYMQFYKDNIGVFGEERERLTETRLPVAPLQPTVVEQEGHAATLTWLVSEQLTVKSISSYRTIDEDSYSNYAGVLYFNGLLDLYTLDQHQYSQELQLIGDSDQVEWVAGLYYLKEDANKVLQDSFSLDIFGSFGDPLTPIDPPTTFDALGINDFLPPRIVDTQARSQAAYGQLTWTPDILANRLHLTLGGRYTEDRRDATRFETSLSVSEQKYDHFDGSVVIDYDWIDNLSTYLKWGSAYKAGGVNTRSASFEAFDEEVSKTWELGLKSEFWQRRARLNMAVFTTDYKDMQLDFSDPVIPTLVETINAAETVEVSGVELDITLAPLVGLLMGLSYTYLDGDMPLQPNPLDSGALKRFFVPLAPQHAGAFTLDYRFEPRRYGTLALHMDITSTDHYSFVPFGEQRTDAYSLINARVELSDIYLSSGKGRLKASVWAKNLLDEEYVIYAFAVGEPAVSIGQAFGDPRTLGVDVTYQF